MLVIKKRERAGAHLCCPLPVPTLLAVALSVTVVLPPVVVVVVVAALLLVVMVMVVVVVVVAGSWWLRLRVVVVLDRCDTVRSHLSELEISLNSDCDFEFFPVSSTNCLEL